MDNEKYYMQFSRAGLSYHQVEILESAFSDACGAYHAKDEQILDIFRRKQETGADSAPDAASDGNGGDERGTCAIRRFLSERSRIDPDADYERMKAEGIGYVSMRHPDYPKRLTRITGRPPGLFYKGRLPSDNAPAVAMVGSRDCSNYGREIAIKLAKGLAGAGIDIISGMAAGIDGYAHRGALNAAPGCANDGAAGQTFAVLGCGVDICYPRSNHDIYSRIIDNGGVISEYCPGTQPVSYNFPNRNRIISGLADAVLVVEARQKSGSWITVDFGLEQGKDIYAVPGRIGDRLSCGCNNLIKSGAKLVTSEEDIIKELAVKYLNRCAKKSAPEHKPVGSEQEAVYGALELTPLSINEICARCGLPVSRTMQRLTELELAGCAARIGASYVRSL